MATVNPYQQSAIRNMSMPQSNQKVTAGLSAANTLGLQTIAQGLTKGLTAGVGHDKMPNVTTAAAQQSVTTGQRAVAKAESDINIQGRVGGAALTQMQDEAKNQLGLRKLSLDNQLSTNKARLSQMNESITSQLVDEQLQFRRDQMGRVRFTERQLMDWAVLKTKSAEQFKDYSQRAEQAHKRYVMAIDIAGRRVEHAIDTALKKRIIEQNTETSRAIAKYRAARARRLQDEQNRSAQGMATWSVVGGLVGAVAGGVVGIAGGPVGIAAGASAGYTVGSGAGAAAYGATR